jgi:uncharacterized SAM-binding protein YcdF (DUF218 family)
VTHTTRSDRLVRGATALLAALGAVLIIVTATPLTGWYSRRLSGPYSDPGGQLLVVLGGDYLEPGIIGESSYWRAVYTVRAYRRWHYPRIILSGAGVSESMRDFLVAMGVPASVIELEQRSHSTRENAIGVQQMLGSMPGPTVLLTSDYHMFRAARVFSKAGMRIEPYPIPHALKLGAVWKTRWPAFLEEASETVKIVYYAARGWI